MAARKAARVPRQPGVVNDRARYQGHVSLPRHPDNLVSGDQGGHGPTEPRIPTPVDRSRVTERKGLFRPTSANSPTARQAERVRTSR
jgi:hypothetical protein